MATASLDEIVRRLAALERVTEETKGDARAASTTVTGASTTAGAALDAANAAAAQAQAAADAATQAAQTANNAATAASNAASAASNALTAAGNAASAASAASSAASTAQTTANGRNKVYRQVGQPTPPAGGFAVNDLWFDQGNDNKPNIWNGSSWIAYALGMAALVVGNLDAAAISTGTLAAERIAATALNANNITAGTLHADRIGANTLTAKNYYSNIAGQPRIVIGPSFYDITKPALYWDLNGDGVVSNNDPRITADATAMLISAGNGRGGISLGSNYAEIGLGSYFHGDATQAMLYYDGNNQLTVSNIGTRTVGNLYSGSSLGGQAIRTDGAAGSVAAVSGTANLATGPSGILKTIIAASTRRIKEDIGALSEPDLDPARLYALPVRQFRYRPDAIAEGDQRSRILIPGLIAEEMAEHYPVAADIGEDGEPATWNPHYLVPAMLKLIQEQHARITELEARVADLGRCPPPAATAPDHH